MNVSNLIEALNSLSLKYANIITIPTGVIKTGEMTIMQTFEALQFARMIHSYGFYIEPHDMLNIIHTTDASATLSALRVTEAYLAEKTGATRKYTTLFGENKTADDMVKAGDDPYLTQLIHYIMVYDYKMDPVGDEEFIDREKVESVREQLKKQDCLQPLNSIIEELMTDNASREILTFCDDGITIVKNIMIRLLGSNNPISKDMKEDVRYFLEFVVPFIPDWSLTKLEIPCKETLAYVATRYLAYFMPADGLVDNINNANDVLRIFAIYSDPNYDGSLSSAPRFKNHLTGEETRFFMTLLTHAEHIETDIFLYPEYWKRAFERIKPKRCLGKRFKKVRDAAESLYSRKKPQTAKGIAEQVVKYSGESLAMFEKGLKRLENFPGTYIRYFDKVVRSYGSKLSDDPQENRHFQLLVCKSLHKVLPQVESTKMLCEMLILYQKRMHDVTNDHEAVRYVKPKGKRAYTPLRPVKEHLCNDLYLADFCGEIANILTQEVTRRFKDLPYLGKVYIDAMAAGVVVPKELREANDSGLHVIGRGSYFRLPTIDSIADIASSEVRDIIVPYIHWTNTKDGERIDLDVSASFFTEDFKYIEGCNYRHLGVYDGNGYMVATHSGDFTTGGPYDGDGVAEYIVVRRKEAVEKIGAKYLVITVHNYTNQSFDKTNAFFGIEYLQEKIDDNQVETINKMNSSRNEGTMTDAMKGIIRPDRTLFTSNLKGDETSVVNVVIDLENSILWYADLATYMSAIESNLNKENELLDDADKSKDNSPFKAFINPHGNNIDATRLSTITQIRALFEKPTLYCGDLMWLHAQVRGHLVKDPKMADVIFTLPDSKVAHDSEEDQEIITPFMVDRITNEFLPVK